MDATLDVTTVGADELELLVEILVACGASHVRSVRQIEEADAQYPGARRFLARVEGEPVGVATIGRISMYPEEFDGLWGEVSVLPEARRQGIGRALYQTICRFAQVRGKSRLIFNAIDGTEGMEFLRRRGYTEWERDRQVRLDLTTAVAPPLDLPLGVTIATLADRPALLQGVYAVAFEATADIPTASEPVTLRSFEEWVATEVARSDIPPDGFLIALDTAGAPIGYASLIIDPRGEYAHHAMTGVCRAWRRCGVAAALKRASIAWAIGRGFPALIAENDIANEPIRAINDRLGYLPVADRVLMRGPVG